ncbi:MAG: aminoglycoside phosphotransferase family protein [Bacteroidetes bacterium]|uniref:Aminoglycoside phosphotransferase family protein n=1 Tax=Candidatus Cryptobacteroides merdavium TaxID=2840769 RepID=A0A9D9EEN4_9BACT|nr:aminoglycoside phosphotransferase family protein [Candidatus Cryptobacteroides merdavium]
MYTEKELFEIISKFETATEAVSIKAMGPGFINDTLTVTTRPDASGKAARYILQRKNHNVFPDVPGMMRNIAMVTEHLRKKVIAAGGDPDREVLKVIRRKPESMSAEEKAAQGGDLYYKDSRGNYWAVSLFIEGSVTYEKADSPALAYKGGEGIGKFQSMLADFTQPLNETIKGFHNIRWRFEQWDEALKKDAAGRVKDLAEEISWIESRKEEMLAFWSLVENGTLPTRVTHNDTKISNILFDERGNVLCVIDLDTCMSSTSLNDFGDAIRSYTNTGAEDDQDLGKVSMSMEMFKAYTEGYLSQRKGTLCAKEAEYLAFSAKYITFEQVLRFLMDYIDGDVYYKTAYPEHNLVRTRAQYRLLQSMEEQYGQMQETVAELMK